MIVNNAVCRGEDVPVVHPCGATARAPAVVLNEIPLRSRVVRLRGLSQGVAAGKVGNKPGAPKRLPLSLAELRIVHHGDAEDVAVVGREVRNVSRARVGISPRHLATAVGLRVRRVVTSKLLAQGFCVEVMQSPESSSRVHAACDTHLQSRAGLAIDVRSNTRKPARPPFAPRCQAARACREHGLPDVAPSDGTSALHCRSHYSWREIVVVSLGIDVDSKPADRRGGSAMPAWVVGAP